MMSRTRSALADRIYKFPGFNTAFSLAVSGSGTYIVAPKAFVGWFDRAASIGIWGTAGELLGFVIGLFLISLRRSAPGSSVAASLPYLPRGLADTLGQGLADMRTEYFDALAAKRPGVARAIRFWWALGLVNTIVLHSGVALVKKLRAAWRVIGG